VLPRYSAHTSRALSAGHPPHPFTPADHPSQRGRCTVSNLQLMALLLATSVALNLGCASGIIASYAGFTLAQAILAGCSTVGGVMMLYFAGATAYRR
jgi:hypothetical protein